MNRSIQEHIAAARRALTEAGLQPADAALDAEVLGRHVLGWDRAALVAHRRDEAPPDFSDRLQTLVERRARREPVALIVGRREFWGLEFELTPATLVPRPETELIVEEALRWLLADAASTVLDVGTGSGCLAIALAHERARLRAIATDISFDALAVAGRNAAAHGVASRVHRVCTDLAAGVRATADVIVSNPPYVPETTAGGLTRDVIAYEPHSALFAGPDGLGVIRRLCAAMPHHLAPGGVLIVEFGYGQEDDVRAVAGAAGWHVVGLLRDLQDIPRTIVLRR